MVLTDSEMEFIRKELGRDPNPLEYGMLDVMFSEHCSYKSSRPVLGLFPTEGEDVIIGPGDDAGVVEITDELALVIGIESHNHPSAIEPYGGAGTGIGGILRDIISMGAMPVALLDSLRFGYLEDQKSRYLFEHVVRGISDYGNRVGVPTVAGEVEFDENFQLNPLVNVMCAGLVPKNDIKRGIAPRPGDVFLLMGGRTGRDGIHGVTFASEELTSSSELEDRPAVQVGDPFTKKMVMEASFEIMDEIEVSGVKDLGGGGLTCCISELVAKCDNGARVSLEAIPLREEGMTPYEIMLSESQERMIFVMAPDDVEAAMEICRKYELPAAVIGEVTDTGRMIVESEGEVIADLPAKLLADPPVVEREARKPQLPEGQVEVKHPPLKDTLLKLISSPNIASKRWVYRQYDHEVQIRTVVKPGDDAAVLRVDGTTGVALTVDCNSIHTKLDPYGGGAASVGEAIRNVVSMGAWPVCIVDCLNFGNPEKPEVFWQFRECVRGMADMAETFSTPVISGNVSFYNETEGVTVNPSPVVGVAGKLSLDSIKTLDFKDEGEEIVVIGETGPELGASEYLRTVHGIVDGKPPETDLKAEFEAAKAVKEIIDGSGNKVTAVHDCSAGGIAVAVAEMAIKSGIGARIDPMKIPGRFRNIHEALFSESNGRYIMTVRGSARDILGGLDVPWAVIGTTGGRTLEFGDVALDISELDDAYHGVIEAYMST
ncbi:MULTISPECIES: phosphoribosylformylglycinamidine synthase subunit PurL [Methanothermobacter]|uniref:Phosphoribosylformylglycinamidine synthase subunit PurL n=2 Tax=Methanothermobacter thermautotrophicus TaxID=145262 RepID=PURL_METTH|nr:MULTISPECIES: phosphoribosylformylglycinamidine synthase subunit PurL [Methanothermobacter]O27427.1 RecName: Full=Phosphoribosylformylglycinamidine synthase subunit PurL; Short=FGAM synthase; AltName: Full=Formylglycinamide ribonucleotide amidotransferase subunit II; Short=FGAR amidotransferase II; Short=FGAR-AT II; AltName: Full=Glutamine amidotransferase PurL; AltName: Full=Phosphoribosylformylglycinamidine synthase subunit II [Methanothermobacter thermautotrophicus str. Delta H]MDK2875133.1